MKTQVSHFCLFLFLCLFVKSGSSSSPDWIETVIYTRLVSTHRTLSAPIYASNRSKGMPFYVELHFFIFWM